MTPVSVLGIPEPTLRLAVFIGVLLLMMTLEGLWPRRYEPGLRRRRWATNLGIVVIGSLCLRLLAAITPALLAVGAASWAQAHDWGLLNLVRAPAWIEIPLAMVLLDALIWTQHLVFHRVPLLWRIHRMHHADDAFDVTTALRFHPIEILLSMTIKVCAVFLLGPGVVAVVLFEVMLNACAMFNHSNLHLPRRLDQSLRTLLVTPDMHRVHHSTDPREHHRNFGFNLSIWDRMFSTYVTQPRSGHAHMQIGLSEFRQERPHSLAWCLSIPFRPLHPAPAPSAAQAASPSSSSGSASD